MWKRVPCCSSSSRPSIKRRWHGRRRGWPAPRRSSTTLGEPARGLSPLLGRGNISQASHDDAIAANLQAKADVKAAEAELRAAELNLSYTEIHAPFAGRIGRSQYSVGDLLGPDSKL
jgi:multidrug efflux pump subunit AcrA (membrane-fusion protein)